jgi:hypothetical protein
MQMQKEGNARPPINLIEIEAGISPTVIESLAQRLHQPPETILVMATKYEVKMLRLAW